jgi:hypothetical protein
MSRQPDVAKEKLAPRENVSGGNSSPQKDKPEQSLSEQDRLYRENLAKEIIAYLSKEIETVTHDMMLFRSKITLSVLLGPFLILGTLVYAAKGVPFSRRLGVAEVIAVVFVCACYFAIAYVAGRIEEDGWRQCNVWRKLISELQSDPTASMNERNVRKDKAEVDPVNWMKWSYLIAFALLLFSFFGSLFIILRVWPPPAPAAPAAVGSKQTANSNQQSADPTADR